MWERKRNLQLDLAVVEYYRHVAHSVRKCAKFFNLSTYTIRDILHEAGIDGSYQAQCILCRCYFWALPPAPGRKKQLVCEDCSAERVRAEKEKEMLEEARRRVRRNDLRRRRYKARRNIS